MWDFLQRAKDILDALLPVIMGVFSVVYLVLVLFRSLRSEFFPPKKKDGVKQTK